MRGRHTTVGLVLAAALLSAPGPAGTAAPAPGALGPASPLPAGALRRFGDERFRIAGRPLASALSPGGTRLAVLGLASAEGRHHVILSVFDADTGRSVYRASVESVHLFADLRLAFSPDGKYLATELDCNARVVWVAATGDLVTRLPPAQAGYSLCQFTPDGLLAVPDEGRIDLYAIPSGRVARTYPLDRVARVTADAKTFARVNPDWQSGATTVGLGDAATGALAWTLPVNTTDNGLGFSADGKLLGVVRDRKFLEVWNTATRKRLARAELPPAAAERGACGQEAYHAVTFSPDGRTIALETIRGAIERWDTRSLAPLPRLVAAGADYIDADAQDIRGVHWSRDGRTVLAAAGNGLVHRWDAQTGKRFPDYGYNGHVRFALAPDGSRLVVGDRVGRIDVWDVATGRVVRQLAPGGERSHALVCLAVSPDGRRVAAGEGHCDIRVFRTEGGECVRPFMCPFRLDGGWMKSLAWAPDGQSLFADGSGMTVSRVNLSDGKTAWGVGDENMPSFALTPDGRFVIKTLWDGIQFLDALTGKEASTVRMAMTQEEGPVGPVACAPDGKRLALVLGRATVVVCDRAGQELRRFTAAGRMAGERGLCVTSLAFTPDGKWIVSGADDRSVRVWEAATGRPVMRFDGHGGAVEQVAVAPDGRSALSAGADGFVYQWDLRPGPYPHSGQRPEDLWAAAAGPDPALAVRAARALVTGSEEVRLLVAGKLPPLAVPKREEISQWLAGLESDEFAEREAATRALAAQGWAVERQLREAARTTASAEARRRAEDLLARLGKVNTAEELRALRLVQACELSGTASARALLARWAGGAPGAVLTEDATAALARLARLPR